jgi:hypothetical protein
MPELTMKISRKQMDTLERLISLQMMGHSVSGCARLLNVSRETIHQWMKNPLYAAMKAREKSEFRAATGDAVISGALSGVRLLENIVNDFRLPAVDRMQAADTINGIQSEINRMSK